MQYNMAKTKITYKKSNSEQNRNSSSIFTSTLRDGISEETNYISHSFRVGQSQHEVKAQSCWDRMM